MQQIIALAFLIILAACSRQEQQPQTPPQMSQETADSMAFAAEHHYSYNYNFRVKADSLHIVRQQPEEVINRLYTDTLTLYKDDNIAVAEIRMISADPVDSVWVQVARDQDTFGWLHESELLAAAVPDDPISQFISAFSDRYLVIFLIVISVISSAYLLRTLFRRNARIVHFNDIPSFYPALLAVTVAASATLYASIRNFADDLWQQFYFHPTLNPLAAEPLIGVFLVSVWAMLIIALAAADEVRNMLPAGQAILYICGLAAVCAVNYIVFTFATLYYIGYPLFAAYAVYAVRAYNKGKKVKE